MIQFVERAGHVKSFAGSRTLGKQSKYAYSVCAHSKQCLLWPPFDAKTFVAFGKSASSLPLLLPLASFHTISPLPNRVHSPKSNKFSLISHLGLWCESHSFLLFPFAILFLTVSFATARSFSTCCGFEVHDPIFFCSLDGSWLCLGHTEHLKLSNFYREMLIIHLIF